MREPLLLQDTFKQNTMLANVTTNEAVTNDGEQKTYRYNTNYTVHSIKSTENCGNKQKLCICSR